MPLLRTSAVALAAGFVALASTAPALAVYGPNSIASANATTIKAINGTTTLVCADSFKPNTPLTFAGPGISGTPNRTSNTDGNTVGTGTAPSNCVTATPTSQTVAGPDGVVSTYSITGSDGHAPGTVTRTVTVQRYLQPVLTANTIGTGSNVTTDICDTQFRSPSTLNVVKTVGSTNTFVVARAARTSTSTTSTTASPCFNTGSLASNTVTKFTFTDNASGYSFLTKSVTITRGTGGSITYSAFSLPLGGGDPSGGSSTMAVALTGGLALVFLSGSALTYRRRRAL